MGAKFSPVRSGARQEETARADRRCGWTPGPYFHTNIAGDDRSAAASGGRAEWIEPAAKAEVQAPPAWSETSQCLTAVEFMRQA